MKKKRIFRALTVMIAFVTCITANAQIVFTKFKEKDASELKNDANLINLGYYMKGIVANYTITSDKKIKEWVLRYYPINKDGDAISVYGREGKTNTYRMFWIWGNDGPYRPKSKYSWQNRELTDIRPYKYIPFQLEILYSDNSVETIKIRKDNFKKYFPNNKWIETDILDLSLDVRNTYLPSSEQSVKAETDNPTPLLVKTEIDTEIPTVGLTNPNTFAVIIANEKYQEVAEVPYALNDGEVFKEYCHKVLGIPEANIHIRKDATLNNMRAELAWMQQVAKAYKGKARFIVYYAGHGIPDEKTGAAYLLPVDGKGTMFETGLSLTNFYGQLSQMNAKDVTVFMDACFSGSKRGEGMLASARGVAIKAKAQAPKGRMVVFSAAQGDETAYPFKAKGHGLFTYYLLKKLKETKGNVTYAELNSYISEEVSKNSIVANGKSQTPTVMPSASLGDRWKTMKLK